MRLWWVTGIGDYTKSKEVINLWNWGSSTDPSPNLISIRRLFLLNLILERYPSPHPAIQAKRSLSG